MASPMASPFSLAAGEEQVDMAEGSQQPSPERISMEMYHMREVITDLQAQLVSLRGEAGHVVNDLEQRLSQHLETRLSQNQAEATATATRAAHVAKPPCKPVRPQRFKGNQDGPKILEWLHQAELYLRAMNMEDQETAVFHISSFLEADAAVWWRHYYHQMEEELVSKPQNWADMRQLMSRQFQIFNHETEVRDRYQALRQTGPVGAYITRFRALVVELPGETEGSKVYQFLKGLKPEIQARTRTHKPHTLEHAMDIADEADRAHTHAHKGGTPSKVYPRGNGGSSPQPMQLGAIAPSAYDLQKLRERNACFYCRRQGHQARDCKKKRADLMKNSRGRRATARKAVN